MDETVGQAGGDCQRMSAQWVDNLRRRALDAFAPARCLYCESAAGAALICPACAARLPYNTPACPGCALPQGHEAPCPACLQQPRPFDGACCAFTLGVPVQAAIHGLKYEARFQAAQALARRMAASLRSRDAPLPEVLVPVPLHPRRLMRRGYNQALELARVIGAELAIPVWPQAARRLRHTPDQIGMSAVQRRRNLRGAFACGPELRGLHVALFDDVMTTGATLGELARVVRQSGATRVEAWALARTP